MRLKGHPETSFYFAWQSRVDPQNPQSQFRNRVRQVKFLAADATPSQAVIEEQLLWEANLGKTPVLDEFRNNRIVPLGKGEYLLDMKFELQASYGDVDFVSDRVHYAWPYVQMSHAFSVNKGGGTITNSAGGVNEKGTHDRPALWVDYSNTIGGVTEGLAIFSPPEEGRPHRWLTRDYGCFGPRRAEEWNGKPFTLKKGESLKQHVGILVHTGDVAAGRVAERYRQFVNNRSISIE